MVFEPHVKNRVLERSQLHRMLANETWLLAEEYNLVADDESLTNVLKRHLRLLGRDELAAQPVTDDDGRTRIVDLMLAKSVEEAQNRREHLVIELKAPRVDLGHKELAQIRDYAQAVINDSQFDTTSTHWDFWVISSVTCVMSSSGRPTNADALPGYWTTGMRGTCGSGHEHGAR
jgi:hypothetical protein